MRALRNSLARNMAALYSSQFIVFLAPLLIVPHLTRVLGPYEWGHLAVAQSFALWNALTIEYGFILSGTRDVARNRGNSPALSRLAADVTAAKVLLSISSGAIAIGMGFATPLFRTRPSYLLLAWCLSVAQGLSPIWYFQGTERLAIPALIEASGRLLGVAGIYLFVNRPADGGLALAAQAVTAALALGANMFLLRRDTGFVVPSLIGALASLRRGWDLFLYRIATSFYTILNVFFLGFFIPPAFVGYYAGAERITSIAIAGFWPFWRTLYPRITHLQQTDPARARSMRRMGVAVSFILGLAASIFIEIFSQPLVRLFLGSGYELSVPTLRLLSPVVPLATLTGSLGILWLVPLGLDVRFSLITVAAAALNVTAIFLFIPRYGISGMALLVVGIEAFLALGILFAPRIRLVRTSPAHDPAVLS